MVVGMWKRCRVVIYWGRSSVVVSRVGRRGREREGKKEG